MKIRLFIIALLLCGAVLGAQIIPTSAQIPITVSVTGFVPNPGSYQLSTINRLTDALDLAKNSPTEKQLNILPEQITPQQRQMMAQDSFYANFQGLRRVKLTRDGASNHFDVLKYLRSGDISQNPLLKDGDVITVPAIHTTVSISGSVYLPGEYEYLQGDRLSDLLVLAQGFTLEADTRFLNLYRYKENLTDFDIIRIDLAATSAETISLKPHDRIIVTQNTLQRRAWRVVVEGSVNAPGEYLIDENTTLYNILRQCGGPTPRGDLRNAIYLNGYLNSAPDPEFERLKEFANTQMTPMEYNYLRSRIRQVKGKYSVDVFRTWESEGRESNPVLHDGDQIFVPELLDMVAVSGQVRRPGLVPWVEGANWKYYIEAAGGYTNNRRYNGVRIIRAASGNWVKPSKNLPINPGDMVFVAEQTDRDIWTDIKDVVSLASQVVTIFIGIYAITSK